MSIYETVKATVTVRQAAEYYGVEVQQNGMCRCPFHNDHHPSMKLNEDYFYCFGCGAHGDVIEFTARLFGLGSYEAAKKLVHDFGLDPDKPPAAAALKKPEYPLAKAFQRDGMCCQRVLCDYLHLLEDWKKRYAPSSPEKSGAPIGTQQCGSDGERTSSGMSELSPQGGSEGYEACEDEDDRFVEACQMLDRVENLVDVLTFEELDVRIKTVDMLKKDGTIDRLEERLNRLEKGERTHGKEQEMD